MNLTLDDLIGKCPSCDGSGKKPQAPAGGGGGSYGRRIVYAGTGHNPEECGQCAGTGRRGLTETGRAVFEFMEAARKLKERGQLS